MAVNEKERSSIEELFSMDGDRTIVTGATGGIGGETAKMFAGLGARVAMLDHKVSKAAQLAQEVADAKARHDGRETGTVKLFSRKSMTDKPVEMDEERHEPKVLSPKDVERVEGGDGTDVLLIPVDVSRPRDVQKAVGTVLGHWGGVDVLVNNAGITKDNLIKNMPDKDFKKVLKVNLGGTFNFTKHVWKTMSEQGKGSIVNVGSVIGETGNAGQVNYAASKGGIIALTKSAALEGQFHRPDKPEVDIRVNAVNPGFTETPMTAKVPGKALDAVKAKTPMGRMGRSKEIAQNILIAAKAPNTTGQQFSPNGGLNMR